MGDASFKTCTKCGEQWDTREAFLADPSLHLIGYQVNFRKLQTGILLFNHSCRTTLGLYVIDFRDLYDGPVFVERATGSDQCTGMCLHQEDLGPCPARCECAFVRHILQAIKQWPKSPTSGQTLAKAAR